MLANHLFWRLMLFYIHLLVLLLQPSVFWLSIVTFNNDAKQSRKQIWCITNPTPARRVTPPWNVYMETFYPGCEGYPVWQTGLPALPGHPTYHVNVIKLKWTGGLPHLSGLTHLPGLPHLHVNRPFGWYSNKEGTIYLVNKELTSCQGYRLQVCTGFFYCAQVNLLK